MTWAVVRVRPDADVRDAARIMHERKLGTLVVADGGHAVGMLTATDIIQAVARSRRIIDRDSSLRRR